MKILVIVPDGVGVRNYLFSNFVSNLIKENNEVFIYHKISNSAINEIKENKKEIKNFEEIPNFKENVLTRILRESLAYARLLRNKKALKNNTILKFWNPSKSTIKKKVLYFICECYGSFLSLSYNLIKKNDAFYESQIKKNPLVKDLEKKIVELNPDLVLNLHQRSTLATPIIIAAKNLKIKTSTVIFSWDNVPKARLVTRYDFYFVWSKLMFNELIYLYPEISNSQVKIVGTPQFEFYFNKDYYETKEIFSEKYGLNINKKTICYSGNDLTSPYEANYLKDICEEISKISIENRPQIIFRKCPVDRSNRFDSVLNKYKDIIVSIDPIWKTEKENDETFTSIYPSFDDISLLVNTINFSDLVINLGSTMAHDAAVLNKPCLYLNYNPVENSTFKVEDVLSFQHFRSMNKLEAVGYIDNKKEIKNKILNGLNDSMKFGKDRKKWLENIVLHPLEKNTEVLIEAIIEIIKT